MTTTAPPAGDTPSWLDRHLASLTTDPRQERTPAPAGQGMPAGQPTQEDHDDGQEA